ASVAVVVVTLSWRRTRGHGNRPRPAARYHAAAPPGAGTPPRLLPALDLPELGDPVHPLLAPVPEWGERALERDAVRREGVDDLGGHLLVDLPVDHTVALQLAQLLDEHLLADPHELAPQLGEPVRPPAQRPEDERLPLAADDGDGGIQAAEEVGAGHQRLLTDQKVSTSQN